MHSIGKALFFLSVSVCCIAAGAGGVPAQDKEKTTTPLAAGVPLIQGIKMLEVGTAAPDFSIRDLQGAPYALSGERGKRPVLLVFWSIFCEPCRIEMPVLQKIHDKYGQAGLDVLAVALDGEPMKSGIAGFVKQEGYSFRVLIDELDANDMFKAADPFGVAGTPTFYLVDKGGKIVLARAGLLPEEDLEKAIQALLRK